MDQGKQSEPGNVQKFDIKLKSRPKDGLILQLHHTIRGSSGEARRIRFSTGTFDSEQEKIACSDNAGNLFILDFTDLKFWKHKNVGVMTALQFVPNKLDMLTLADSKTCDIIFLDIETGHLAMTLSGHTAPVKHISFSNNKLNNLLTASSVEAILWELTNYTKYFTLNTYSAAQIQDIMFMPNSDYLVACFQNDTIQIWKHDSMKSVKQIIPNELKHMKSIAFTANSRAMAMAGLTPILILFSMDTWKAIKSINLSIFNISGAQQIAFVPQVFDGGANKILGILTSDCTLCLLDLESVAIICRICPESSGIRKIVISPSGKYFLCLLHLGEVNIYNTTYVLENTQSEKKLPPPVEPCTSTHKPSNPLPMSKIEVEQKMRYCMDSARLRRILEQYGEYPNKFRSVIWRSLLNTPKNVVAYGSLVDKGIHPSYKDIEKQFTIHSSATLKSLKRLLSCLAHWCPLFGVIKFLPGFVFPFVKVLQKDPLLLFECVATILLNYCQLWFEYAPFPPLSILAMAENILAEHDQPLLNHYCNVGITSQTYALKILETAFSEVLTCSEWLILWDHILSNEPAFIIMGVVSYNVVQRNAIKKITSHEQLENYFHKQNPIDKKLFLKKAYVFLNDTTSDIHPRKFLHSFISLDKGDCYQQFMGYPKATICLKLAKKDKQKDVKSNKYSLKELTKKSQEKETIRFQKYEDSDTKSGQSSSEECNIAHTKKVKKKVNHNIDKIDLYRKQFLGNIFPERDIDVNSATNNGNSNIRKNSPKSNSRKKTSDLEKEIEKLVEMESNSD